MLLGAAVAVLSSPAEAARLLEDVGDLAPVDREVTTDCPLYVSDFESSGADRKLRARGRVVNAGPGLARVVTVELALVDEGGDPIASYRARSSPHRLEAGDAGSFDLVIQGGDWHRALSDVSYARTRISVEAVRCSPVEPTETDAAGRRLSDYRRLALSALEERMLLDFAIDDARDERIRLELRDASRRLRDEASEDLFVLRARRREIDRYLEEELPLEMRAAEAPESWLEDLMP